LKSPRAPTGRFQGHSDLLNRLQDDLASDDLFLVSLPPIEDGLLELVDELKSEAGYCGSTPGAGSSIRMARSTLLGLRNDLIRMRQYVADAGAKRSELLEATAMARRIVLTEAYAQRAGAALADVQAHIDATFAADELYGRLGQWWQTTMIVAGPLQGLATRELQYREALRALAVAKERLAAFEKELDAITTLSDSVRRLVAGDLEGYSRQLDQIGDALRDSGWQGVFARQKLLTAQRRRHADALPKISWT
jgi:hypothetical protein